MCVCVGSGSVYIYLCELCVRVYIAWLGGCLCVCVCV